MMSPVVVFPRRFEDSRGWFSETWNATRMAGAGLSFDFCQDNQSLSQQKGTLRGLHFQAPPFAQTKLVQCLNGRIFDVAVDIRRGSPTFGQWRGVELSSKLGNQFLIPAGFAHGFLTLEPDCLVAYKVDARYAPEADGGVAWNDPQIAIAWPLEGEHPKLSAKDAELPRLHTLAADFPYDGLPLENSPDLMF